MTTTPPPALAEDLPRLTRATDGRSAERFLEVVGPRVALLGDELGRFEAWVWPLKVLRRLEPAFTHQGAPPLSAAEASRGVEVAPHRALLRYGGPGWSAVLTLFAAPDARAVVGLVEAECSSPLRITLLLEAELRPMWPAGMGGQVARTDEQTGALLLTEELGRFAVLIGSPEAEPVHAAGDHALPRDPVRLELVLTPARARRGPLPFVLAGAELEPPALTSTARLGQQGASRGQARSHHVVARAREAWHEALREWPRWRVELRERWSAFLQRCARIESDTPLLDEAFRWAQVAIERAWVEVDGLGRGLVAGLGPSRDSERPGFGWFFDGDALVAARAQCGYGDFAGAREVLRFAASHQRGDGKLMHELVLSARLCNWLEDYPYAYYKAGNTPAFLALLAHYVATSGDLELARELWPSALSAFEHCLRCLDPGGLLSVRKAGLAAVEAGPLVGRLRAEVYLQGIWISAARGLRDLARLLGERAVEARARTAAEESEEAFERFWSELAARYGFARLDDGSLDAALSAYLGLPLGRGLGRPEHAQPSAQALNHPALSTEWGARMFAADAAVYDPSDYNTGSVFPYLTGHVILAQYRQGLPASAWQGLAGQLALHGFGGLGFVPEHLYGDRCQEPPRGVPHQIFSSSAVVQSLLHGLLGLSAHALEDALLVRPALPPHMDRLDLLGFRVGRRLLDLRLRRERAHGRTELVLDAELRAGEPLKLFFRPWLPAASHRVSVAFDDEQRSHPVPLEAIGAALAPQGPALELAGRARVRLGGELGPEPWLDTQLRLERGQPPRAVRLAGVRCAGEVVRWTFWGPAGSRACVPLSSDRRLEVAGATRDSLGALELAFPAQEAGGFTPVEVTLEALP